MRSLPQLYSAFNNMFKEEEERGNAASIDWVTLTSGAIEEIKEKLFMLENDSQRNGFLCTVFRNLSDNGKEYWFDKYNKEGLAAFENTQDYKYVEECCLARNEIIFQISEATFYYENLDFNEIMLKTGVNTIHNMWSHRVVQTFPPQQTNVNSTQSEKVGTSGICGTSGTKEAEPKNLLDIWETGTDREKDFYYKVIERLKNEHPLIERSFVTEHKGKLHWNKNSGGIQYLAGFIYLMTKKGWIAKWYSSTTYKRILEATFNIEFNPKPFKSLDAGLIDHKYLEPFTNWENNI